MALCLRCMQEGKYVDVETCDHKVTLATTEPAEADTKEKK